MTRVLCWLAIAPLFAGSMDCSASADHTRSPAKVDVLKPGEHCQMALVALDAVIKHYSDQPLGLEKTCVDDGAVFNGKVYVDARFTKNRELELVSEPSCTSERYVVRFDHQSFAPSPSKDVVVLILSTNSPPTWRFSAVTEVPDWPKRRPGIVTLSSCGSAFGVLRQVKDRWEATVVPPPRSPEAL
jgi:hypothetical protein